MRTPRTNIQVLILLFPSPTGQSQSMELSHNISKSFIDEFVSLDLVEVLELLWHDVHIEVGLFASWMPCTFVDDVELLGV